MKTVWVVLGMLAFIVVIVIASFVSAYNYGNRAEKAIVAEYTNMENILAQYSLKVREVAQVPGMKTEDLQKVTRDAMLGRYGENGSKAVFQWIQENYPGQVTDTSYVQLQQVMEAGRDEVKNTQTKFIDTMRAYNTNLGYLWKGFLLRTAGYPKIDLSKYKIISSESARKAFETGVDEPIKLR